MNWILYARNYPGRFLLDCWLRLPEPWRALAAVVGMLAAYIVVGSCCDGAPK